MLDRGKTGDGVITRSAYISPYITQSLQELDGGATSCENPENARREGRGGGNMHMKHGKE